MEHKFSMFLPLVRVSAPSFFTTTTNDLKVPHEVVKESDSLAVQLK